MNFLSAPRPAIEALAKGDLRTAASLLGSHYFLCGNVIHGDHLGKKLGFPTANLRLDEESPLLIPFGVYVVKLAIGNNMKSGLASIGIRPTVNGKDLRVEVHVFDFSGDLYQQHLKVFFIERVRDELKFNSLEELVRQMEKDRNDALALLSRWGDPDSHT